MEYDVNESGMWAVRLADTNCDYSGPHFNGFNGMVLTGKYGECLEYARKNVKGFRGWGEGYLQKITVTNI